MTDQEEISPELSPTLRARSGSASRGRAPTASGVLVSRDEMNLAEFPLAVLSTRVDPSVKTLEFADQFRTKGGDLVERKWIITGADKFGLPTSTDDDVVLGLIRLTMDQGFRSRKVYFTRYELLRVLRWTTEGRSYTRLVKSLDRLSGVRIRASNSFYDNASKSYQTRNFGIIDAYELNDTRGRKARRVLAEEQQLFEDIGEESPPPTDGMGEEMKSYFIWSEILFDSFKSGFIKKLDMNLYFSLRSAVSRRLYRYLDKHFYFKPVVERPLMFLAFQKLGLSRNYRYISTIKQQIEPAAEELLQSGFISGYEYSGRGDETVVRFLAANSQSGLTPQVPDILPSARGEQGVRAASRRSPYATPARVSSRGEALGGESPTRLSERPRSGEGNRKGFSAPSHLGRAPEPRPRSTARQHGVHHEPGRDRIEVEGLHSRPVRYDKADRLGEVHLSGATAGAHTVDAHNEHAFTAQNHAVRVHAAHDRAGHDHTVSDQTVSDHIVSDQTGPNRTGHDHTGHDRRMYNHTVDVRAADVCTEDISTVDIRTVDIRTVDIRTVAEPRLGAVAAATKAGSPGRVGRRGRRGSETELPHQVSFDAGKARTTGLPHLPEAAEELIDHLIERGISPPQARRLIEGAEASEYSAIREIVRYYDYLLSTNDPKISRNPLGFLYRAVEQPNQFRIPPQFSPNSAAGSPASRRPEHKIFGKGRESAPRMSTEEKQLYDAYKAHVDQLVTKRRASLPTAELDEIYSTVEKKMECLRAVLPPERFREAIEGCVKDECIRLFGIPDFKEWLSGVLRNVAAVD